MWTNANGATSSSTTIAARGPSVLDCDESTVGSDQEIGRQAEGASGRLDGSDGTHRAAPHERSGLAGDRRAQRTPTQQRARTVLDAELLVQLPFRIGDER